MRQSAVKPTGVERRLGPDDLIVSKTDPKGRITYANQVFCEFSAYREEEIIGRPHNLVRHPQMPRAVFKLLWETISVGREVFVYVLNLAGDGAEYWVLAHVTPSFGDADEIVGYHSNRRCPDRGAVETVKRYYADLVAAERRHSDPAKGLAASSEMLASLLAERGVGYDELVWSITPAEAAA